MRIWITSVFVDDQEKALRFYTEVLGFVKKEDMPAGGARWLTVVSPEDPDGPELLLEPAGHPAVGPYREALRADGIPCASFAVSDVRTEYRRLQALGVRFTQEPVDVGPTTMAIFDDTCGNLIQIVQRLVGTAPRLITGTRAGNRRAGREYPIPIDHDCVAREGPVARSSSARQSPVR